MLWQIALVGYTFALAGHAAANGSRALAVGESVEQSGGRGRAGALARGDARAGQRRRGARVTMRVPLVIPGVQAPLRVTDRKQTVVEGGRRAGRRSAAPRAGCVRAVCDRSADRRRSSCCGMLPLHALLALAAWQLLLTGSAAMTAASAARTGSRAQSFGQDARSAAEAAVPRSHRCAAGSAAGPEPVRTVRGERVDVRVCVPVVMPAVDGCAFELTQSAELPRTD